MSIIEKLGIKTPDKLNIVEDVWAVYDIAGLKRPNMIHFSFIEAEILKKHLDDKNELLVHLINECIRQERTGVVWISAIAIIEKSTGKTWEVIRKLK